MITPALRLDIGEVLATKFSRASELSLSGIDAQITRDATTTERFELIGLDSESGSLPPEGCRYIVGRPSLDTPPTVFDRYTIGNSTRLRAEYVITRIPRQPGDCRPLEALPTTCAMYGTNILVDVGNQIGIEVSHLGQPLMQLGSYALACLAAEMNELRVANSVPVSDSI